MNNMCSQLQMYIENVFFVLLLQQLAEHYRVPAFHSLFSQFSTVNLSYCLLYVKCSKKKVRLRGEGSFWIFDRYLHIHFGFISDSCLGGQPRDINLLLTACFSHNNRQ